MLYEENIVEDSYSLRERNRAIRVNVIEVLITVRYPQESRCALGLRALVGLIATSPDFIIEALLHENFPVLLAERMRKFRPHASVQRGCCSVFALMTERSIAATTELRKAEAVQSLLRTMLVHSRDPRVQVGGCRAIAAMAKQEETNALLLDHGGETAALRAAIKFPGDAWVQWRSCGALRALLDGASAADIPRLLASITRRGESGRVKEVMETSLKSFPNDQFVRGEASAVWDFVVANTDAALWATTEAERDSMGHDQPRRDASGRTIKQARKKASVDNAGDVSKICVGGSTRKLVGRLDPADAAHLREQRLEKNRAREKERVAARAKARLAAKREKERAKRTAQREANRGKQTKGGVDVKVLEKEARKKARAVAKRKAANAARWAKKGVATAAGADAATGSGGEESPPAVATSAEEGALNDAEKAAATTPPPPAAAPAKPRTKEDEMASILQRRFRAHRSRRLLLSAIANRFTKQFDPDSGYSFYIDARTGQATWEKPALLKEDEDLAMSPEEEAAAKLAAEHHAAEAAAYEYGAEGEYYPDAAGQWPAEY